MSPAQVVNALATAQLEAKRIADEAAEDSKVTGAQDFDLQVENMSKVCPISTGAPLSCTCRVEGMAHGNSMCLGMPMVKHAFQAAWEDCHGQLQGWQATVQLQCTGMQYSCFLVSS